MTRNDVALWLLGGAKCDGRVVALGHDLHADFTRTHIDFELCSLWWENTLCSGNGFLVILHVVGHKINVVTMNEYQNRCVANEQN